MVVDEITPLDWFALKLSCKAFADFLPEKLQDVIRRFDHDQTSPGRSNLKNLVIQTITRFEYEHAGSINTKKLTCTHCGHLRPRTLFPDSHVKSLEPKVVRNFSARMSYYTFSRICIPCGANKASHRYTKRPYIRVGGKLCFVCCQCEKAKPLPDEEVSRKRSGKESYRSGLSG